ncbi:WD40 repeat-like protein [Irpex lacteus]|nr:WD40 repeat-like protein [Irpex lacteus]
MGYIPKPLLGLSTSLFHNERFPVSRHSRFSVVEGLMQTQLPYSRRLVSHTSCVNMLAVSPDGRWLASAGDDPYVHLWDFHQTNLVAPDHSFRGHRSNVFALTFSATGRHLFSGDTDDTILKYDLSHLPSSTTPQRAMLPSHINLEHSGSIRAISCHPFSDDVFLSASEDGCIITHDSRDRNGASISRAQRTLQGPTEFTGVQFHPEAPDLFVTSADSGQVCLRDVRMAFGPLSGRSNNGIVKTFVTTLAKPLLPHLARPEASSVTFDKTGSKICVTLLGYLPTIYSLDDEYPLATCSADCLPDGSSIPPTSRTYSNACTMKHGSFGGPGLDVDEYYAAGSDDFCGYVWKIPSIPEMKVLRETLTDAEYYQYPRDTVAFTSTLSSPRTIPLSLSRPLCRLGGHKSIVNSAIFHPSWPYVFTAGVERHITLHSPFVDSPCAPDLEKTDTEVRQLPSEINDPAARRRLLEMLVGERDESDEVGGGGGLGEDQGIILMFDE